MQTKKKGLVRLGRLTDEILQIDREYNYSPSQDLTKKKKSLSLQTEFNTFSTQQAEYLNSKSRQGYEHSEKAGCLLAHQLRRQSANQAIPVINNELHVTTTLELIHV